MRYSPSRHTTIVGGWRLAVGGWRLRHVVETAGVADQESSIVRCERLFYLATTLPYNPRRHIIHVLPFTARQTVWERVVTIIVTLNAVIDIVLYIVTLTAAVSTIQIVAATDCGLTIINIAWTTNVSTFSSSDKNPRTCRSEK
jgi:hypothetical protein